MPELIILPRSDCADKQNSQNSPRSNFVSGNMLHLPVLAFTIDTCVWDDTIDWDAWAANKGDLRLRSPHFKRLGNVNLCWGCRPGSSPIYYFSCFEHFNSSLFSVQSLKQCKKNNFYLMSFEVEKVGLNREFVQCLIFTFKSDGGRKISGSPVTCRSFLNVTNLQRQDGYISQIYCNS